ncbi:P-II family nitrogen regulator, partial [Pelomicrobium sp. G1]
MELKAVLAFVRRSALDKVEDKLHEIGVKGLTMMKVKGHGEY